MKTLYFWVSEIGNSFFYNFLSMRGIEVVVNNKSDVVTIMISNEDQENWLNIGAKHFFGSAEPTPFFTEE